MSEGTPDEDVFPGAKLSDPAMVRGMLRDAAQEKAEKDGEPGKWD